jgi:hypothetical protein
VLDLRGNGRGWVLTFKYPRLLPPELVGSSELRWCSSEALLQRRSAVRGPMRQW